MTVLSSIRDLCEIRTLPAVTVSLMRAQCQENDEFYRTLLDEFYASAMARHRKLPLFRKFTAGVALCELPESFDSYFMQIEAAARNYKKAARNGYEFRRIDYNEHLEDIGAIRRSTETRQGKVSRDFLEAAVRPCENPPSLSPLHDYAYFGVHKEGRLWSYAGCNLLGEVCLLEHIYGHAERHSDGVVPMLIIGIAEHLLTTRPHVKHYVYGGYYGAGESMRRFKRKFLFLPHNVTWKRD